MKSGSFNLKKLVDKIGDGELQIPDFQRDWVWSDEQIKSLIESVIRGFPINSIMLLECDASNTKFSYKPIEGVTTSAEPNALVLDGQQRLTSLYGALRSQNPVKISDSNKCYYYYVDMKKAVDSIKNSVNVEDMIISVPAEKKTKTLDLSTPEKEYAAKMFPLNQLLDSDWADEDWILNYNSSPDSDNTLAMEFNKLVIKACSRYDVVYVELEKTTPIAVVCKIFENVNTGGTELTVFNLLTAILAVCPDGNGGRINLPEDWRQIKEQFSESQNASVLSVVNSTHFVTALTLLVSYENSRADRQKSVGCGRKEILDLQSSDYLNYKDCIVEGFIAAAKFLDGQRIRTKTYLPYTTQLIPLAAIYAELKLRNITPVAKKIEQWYWCGVFGESYSAAQETRYRRDLSEVMAWFDSETFPKIITETQMNAARLLSLKTKASGAYKGIMTLIFKNDAKDFLNGAVMSTEAASMESIDVHHIFPKKYCETRGFNAAAADSVANRTPISGKTNKTIGSKAPSKYMKEIETKGHSSADVDAFF